jgi:protein-S-isoprenylcysteine O-methyltransferase Ste14
MEAEKTSRKKLLFKSVVRGLSFVIIMPLLFRLISGTWAYWQGWVFLLLVLVPVIWVVQYFFRHDPSVLERRLRYKEKITAQAWFSGLAGVVIMLAIFLPGLDIRFGWSHVPVWLVIISEAMVLIGYLIFVQVMRTNAYLSRVVEVTGEQQVVSTGLYGIIRHPMYAGVILMSVFTSLALGSYWFVIPGLLVIPAIIFRLLGEEKYLAKELPGYVEYMAKTRFRLVPGIW